MERKGLAKYAEKIVEVTDVARIHWLKPKRGEVFGPKFLVESSFQKIGTWILGYIVYILVMISSFSTLDSLMLFVNYQ